MHAIDRFRHGMHNNTPPLGTPTEAQAVAFFEWVKREGIHLFIEAFEEETNAKIPSPTDGQLVEQAYPKGQNEFDKKHAQSVYFAANARIFEKICTIIVDNIVASKGKHGMEPFFRRHYELVHKLMLDAHVLLDDWARLNQGVPGMYGIGKNTIHDAMQISHAAQQLMFAGSPLFSFSDNATYASTALIRVAIETRLRFGFGLLGVRDLATDTVKPLNLSRVIDAAGKHVATIDFAVQLQHISRIYSWANIYVHMGWTHYMWSPIFAHQYLGPFLRGRKYPGGMSVHAGIITDAATVAAIQAETAVALNLDPARDELIKLDPKDCWSIVNP